MTLSIEPLLESHIPEAQRIFRVAFGTQLNLPEPEKFGQGVDYFTGRRRMAPEGAWVALEDGRPVGSVLTSRWGSMAFFGPLTIDPPHWNRRIGQRLMEPVIECFAAWGTTLEGLFTFPSSPKHLALYQKYGFHPGNLVAMLVKAGDPESPESAQHFQPFSRLNDAERDAALTECRDLSHSIFDGLDLSREIESVAAHNLGETILLRDQDRIDAFAVCHHGMDTEAGPEGTWVKFAAARPGPGAEATFTRLIQACEAYARSRGASRLLLGMNTGRRRAYAALLKDGFRIAALGIAMHRDANGHYHHDSDFVVEDLR